MSALRPFGAGIFDGPQNSLDHLRRESDEWIEDERMTQAAAAKRTNTPVEETADLGFALLIAEGEGGGY
jgi:hypothetical protein